MALSSAPTPEAPPSWQKSDARLSSDEGEADPPEDSEKPLCHYSPHHPRPLSVSVSHRTSHTHIHSYIHLLLLVKCSFSFIRMTHVLLSVCVCVSVVLLAVA